MTVKLVVACRITISDSQSFVAWPKFFLDTKLNSIDASQHCPLNGWKE
jgi:hypothetical protein